MPHVKLAGALSVEDAWTSPPDFKLSIPEMMCHIKFVEAFLGSAKTACIFRFVVAEGRLTQHVQVLLAQDEESWLLKLDRTYPVLRTPGLKLLLGILARWLERRGATISRSNIGDFLAKGAFYADHPPVASPDAPDPIPGLVDPLIGK